REVFAGAGPGRRPQPRLVELGRRGEGLEQCLLTLCPLAILRRLLRHCEPRLGRETLDGLDKIEVLGAHQIADRIAMRAAAKAVKEALILDDVKRGGLFVMKRAEAAQLATPPDQLYAPSDERAQRHAGAQFVKKARRKGHPLNHSPALRERVAGATPALRSHLPPHPNSCFTTAPARAMSKTPTSRSFNPARISRTVDKVRGSLARIACFSRSLNASRSIPPPDSRRPRSLAAFGGCGNSPDRVLSR